MSTTELKFEIIKRIMETDEDGFDGKIQNILNQYYPEKQTETKEPEVYNIKQIIAYKADGQALTIKDLKAEILEIIDDTCKGSAPSTHCKVKTRLKGILWL
ncbi:hypothetical protein FMM05_05910 [Flavobacterium zepuense]|uniref:Uncharacterized protein n=1 Tax=Flavobacterium zepuense TaxID=2593302 RepID=A0A552V5K5_9FLAO|nr:hypothetical protein [Flavobacterium zepuense]TRW25755.1 hypothetical protein FMM05_05910 [Flavobacterium zepuense]